MLPTRLRIPPRWLALLICLGCGSVLVVAAYLTPSRSGVATHTALGFNNCALLTLTKVPCPTCGMTTATSWFVRGHFLASLYTQPMGFVFALLTATTFWVSLYIAVTGRPSHRLLSRLPIQRVLLAFLAFAIAAWAWKIFIHLNSLDGWG